MKDENKFSSLPLNLQFFAAGGADEGSEPEGSAGDEGSKGNETGNQNQDNNAGSNTGTKTFTQEEVNKIGATEKNQGKNSIMKLFGVANEEEAKTEAEAYKKWKESQLTEEQKRAEVEKALKKSANESEKRAKAAENKLAALQAGVNNDSLDDALAIALLKVTDDKPLDSILAEMKKEARYSGFFGASPSSGGTGSSTDHSRGGSGTENIGARLAKNKAKSAVTESKFFKN